MWLYVFKINVILDAWTFFGFHSCLTCLNGNFYCILCWNQERETEIIVYGLHVHIHTDIHTYVYIIFNASGDAVAF